MAKNNYNPKDSTLTHEEQNELDALDIVIGLSREERSYLLSVWRTDSDRPSFALVRSGAAARIDEEVSLA